MLLSEDLVVTLCYSIDTEQDINFNEDGSGEDIDIDIDGDNILGSYYADDGYLKLDVTKNKVSLYDLVGTADEYLVFNSDYTIDSNNKTITYTDQDGESIELDYIIVEDNKFLIGDGGIFAMDESSLESTLMSLMQPFDLIETYRANSGNTIVFNGENVAKITCDGREEETMTFKLQNKYYLNFIRFGGDSINYKCDKTFEIYIKQ